MSQFNTAWQHWREPQLNEMFDGQQDGDRKSVCVPWSPFRSMIAIDRRLRLSRCLWHHAPWPMWSYLQSWQTWGEQNAWQVTKILFYKQNTSSLSVLVKSFRLLTFLPGYKQTLGCVFDLKGKKKKRKSEGMQNGMFEYQDFNLSSFFCILFGFF